MRPLPRGGGVVVFLRSPGLDVLETDRLPEVQHLRGGKNLEDSITSVKI